MTMEEWVKMWRAIVKNESPNVPAQLHLRGQLTRITDAFGSVEEAYYYFRKVLDAEAPEIPKKED